MLNSKDKAHKVRMPDNKTYKFYSISLKHILWALIPGFVITIIVYPGAFLSPGLMIFVVLYSFSMGLPYQKTIEYIEIKLDEKIPWLRYPGKRLLVNSIYQTLLGIVILLIVNFVLYIFIRKSTTQAFLKESFDAIKYVLLCILPGIPISNSFVFFKSWKQAAINAEILKREKLTMEYEALKNQVNPHFFFNSLTVLISLVKTDTEKAVEFIRQFSKIFRYRLEYHQNQVVDLETEKKILEAVAFLYQIRFENELKININLPESKERFIVPMVLQMLVENAVKHNMASKNKPLNVEIYMNGDYIIVKNNLQLKRTGVFSNKLGLKNIQSQYKYLSKKEVIIENDNEYYTVKIPILDKL